MSNLQQKREHKTCEEDNGCLNELPETEYEEDHIYDPFGTDESDEMDDEHFVRDSSVIVRRKKTKMHIFCWI